MRRRQITVSQLRGLVILLVVLELNILVVVEILFIRSSILEMTDSLVKPAIEAVVFPAQFSVDMLNVTLAEEICDGIVSINYFDTAAIYDDFGKVLAKRSEEIQPSQFAQIAAKIVVVSLQYSIETPLISRFGTEGRIQADVNLTSLFLKQLRYSATRTMIILGISFMLTLFVALKLLYWIDRDVRELVNWTDETINQGNQQELEVRHFLFAEIQHLYTKVVSAFKSQKDAHLKLSAAYRERSDLLTTVSQAFGNMDIFTSLFGEDEGIIFTNAETLEDQPIKRALSQFPKNLDQFSAMIEEAGLEIVTSGTGESAEGDHFLFRIHASSGSKHWILQAYLFESDFILLAATEVTDIKEQEKRAQHARKLEALGRILSGVGHEFNNVLQIIVMNAEEAQATASSERSEATGYIQSILDSAERARIILKQLAQLARSKVEDNTVLRIDEWQAKTQKLLKTAVGPGIDVVFEYEPDLYVAVNASLFDAALLNLCKNSADAMGEVGEIRIKIERAAPSEVAMHSGLPVDRSYISTSVLDTGPGIPPEYSEKLFEPFFSTKPVAAGLGLGLSTVYGFASNSGGGIRLDNRHSGGACFVVLLPEANIDARKSGEVEAQSLAEVSGLLGVNILLVEDEKTLRRLTSKILDREGALVHVAGSIEEARETLSEISFLDVALVDNVLPDGSGLELFASIRKKFPQCCLVCVSGSITLPDVQFEDGVQTLTKPVSRLLLLRTVQSALKSLPPG